MKGNATYIPPMLSLGEGQYVRADLVEVIVPPNAELVNACRIAYIKPPRSMVLTENLKFPIGSNADPEELIRRLEVIRSEREFAESEGIEAALERTRREAQASERMTGEEGRPAGASDPPPFKDLDWKT